MSLSVYIFIERFSLWRGVEVIGYWIVLLLNRLCKLHPGPGVVLALFLHSAHVTSEVTTSGS